MDEQTPKKCVLKKNWTMCSEYINHSRCNRQHSFLILILIFIFIFFRGVETYMNITQRIFILTMDEMLL